MFFKKKIEEDFVWKDFSLSQLLLGSAFEGDANQINLAHFCFIAFMLLLKQ